jgi:hypothetical protein
MLQQQMPLKVRQMQLGPRAEPRNSVMDLGENKTWTAGIALGAACAGVVTSICSLTGSLPGVSVDSNEEVARLNLSNSEIKVE